MPLLKIDQLTKVYNDKVLANDNVCLDADAGEVVGLLGHNGAGKTTLLSQVIGLVRPTKGRIELCGRDPVADPAYARQCCSMQLQSQTPLEGVTPRQAIVTIGQIRGGRRGVVRARANHLMAALDIAEWADAPGNRLSGGVRRLTAFCIAAVMPGRLVMLDEPTNDVDPVRRRLMWRMVRSLADDGHCVLVVTHNVIEAERVLDRVVILDKGRVAAAGTPAELRSRSSDQLRLEVAVATEGEVPLPDWATRTAMDGHRLVSHLAARDAGSAVQWAQRLLASGLIQEFSLNPISLEDVYVELTDARGDSRDGSLVS